MKTENWTDQIDAEERLSQLRQRDLEISRISLGLQMRTRISRLEHEIKLLRKMEDAWILSRFSRFYFFLTRLPRSLWSIIQKRLHP
jgi:hypothetical protein